MWLRSKLAQVRVVNLGSLTRRELLSEVGLGFLQGFEVVCRVQRVSMSDIL